MKKTSAVGLALVVILAAALAGISQRLFFAHADATSGSGSQPGTTLGSAAPRPTGCPFLSSPGSPPAFCDTFDAPAGTGNRSGDLNGTVWGVSRITQNHNPSQGVVNGWWPTPLDLCGTTITAKPVGDVRICDGHVAEASTDGGNATALAMYPKQPFDIAGRTGTVTFDVSNDTQGPHGAWPEFWYTDQPVPSPVPGLPGLDADARNGLGIRLFGVCTTASGADGWTVGSAVIVTNYHMSDSFLKGTPVVSTSGCVSQASASRNTLNHVELHVALHQVDVYATDAYPVGGALPPLQHIGTVTNITTPLTRGVIWTIDAHYNGDKFGTQGTHTFYWDNVGFDGPVLPQDRAFDVLDNAAAGRDGSINTGWVVTQPQNFPVPGVTSSAISNAQGALLTFNFWNDGPINTVRVAVNGHSHDLAWPYPTTDAFSVRTLAIPIAVSDLVAGTNTVTFAPDGNTNITVFNVDLIALGGGGGSSGGTSGGTSGGSTPPTPAPQSTPIAINGAPCTVSVNGVSQSGVCTGQFTLKP